MLSPRRAASVRSCQKPQLQKRGGAPYLCERRTRSGQSSSRRTVRRVDVRQSLPNDAGVPVCENRLKRKFGDQEIEFSKKFPLRPPIA